MIIGLTGGIGSGKSTIGAGLRALGYPVYETDQQAKRIIISNPMVRSQVELLFGSEVLDGDIYHTELVAKQVFHHPDLLERLNRIVHPAVAFDVQEWARMQVEKHHGQSVCFVESAILYESGLDKLCAKVVAVTAPEEIRIERTIARDHTDINKVRARIRAQETAEDIRRADFIVNNDGKTEINILCLQIRDFLRTFAG